VVLQPGDPAPDVAAPNQHDESTAPSFESPTVLYVYPEDGTPGCTTEAGQFVRERASHEDAGVAVYGVSTDTVDSHRAFADEQGVWFDLLADPEGDVAEAFGVELRERRAPRTTFVLADGAVHRVYESVDPDGHARDVMLDLLDDGLVELEGG
jgi:peroxiredoxin Q/BCP